MENYVEAFREEFRWNTNWKVLAENFMESYHLPVCHEGTIGGHVDLMKMTCPEGLPAFNYHYIIKNDALDLTLAHPTNTTLEGRRAAHDLADLGLPVAADHAFARILLVSLPDARRARTM